MKQDENIKLSSTESMRISLEAVRTGGRFEEAQKDIYKEVWPICGQKMMHEKLV